MGRMLRFFGARQIKNRATVGGNLCTASPIGDLAPVLLSLKAQVTLRSWAGTRQMPLDDFFTGYRQTALQTGEILDSIRIPCLPAPPADVRCCSYKVSKRQELDISTVSAGVYVQLDSAGCVEVARFAFGGMAATPKRASLVEQAVMGHLWSQENLEAALALLPQDFTPIDDYRGSAWYRHKVAGNLLRGFFLDVISAELRQLASGLLPRDPGRGATQASLSAHGHCGCGGVSQTTVPSFFAGLARRWPGWWQGPGRRNVRCPAAKSAASAHASRERLPACQW